MNRIVDCLSLVYLMLLKAYPPEFRSEFEVEMQAAFQDQMSAAGKRGHTSFLLVTLHELRQLPVAIGHEYWLLLRKWKEAKIMANSLNVGLVSTNSQPSLENGSQPDNWRGAFLAGVPHLILTVLLIVVTFATRERSGEPLLQVIEITTVVFTWSLVGLLIVGLFIAWRMGWPRWGASYYFYGFVILAAPLLLVTQNHGWDRYLMLFYTLALLVWIYFVIQRDAVKGLLMVTPIVVLAWFPVLEFIPGEFRNPLQVSMLLITALAAMIIARYGSWRVGIWTLISTSLLVGMPISYYRTYHHNIPPQYADASTVTMLTGRYTQALFWSGILVVAPLLVWVFWELAKRSGRAGALSYQLLFAGLLLNLTGNLVANSWYTLGRRTSSHLLAVLIGGLMLVGAVLYFVGLVKLLLAGQSAGILKGSLVRVLLVLVAIVLPFVFMFPMFGMRRYTPSDLPFGLFYENNVPDVLVYGLSLLWMLGTVWLITRLKVPPRSSPDQLESIQP